jgi:hypothetical protein
LIIAILTRWYLIVVSFAFPWWLMLLNIFFQIPVDHLHVFLGKMYLQVLCLFFINQVIFLLLNWLISLNILDINPFPDTWHKIFSSIP